MYVGLGQLPNSTVGPASGSWADVLKSLALTGGQIAQKRLAFRPGEFIQTAEGVRSLQVPGAVPTATAWPGLPAAGGGFGVGTWLVMGTVVLGVVLVASKK